MGVELVADEADDLCLGVHLAAELAARHPDRVRTLWLLDPAVAEVARPASDPLYGPDGPLLQHWTP